MPSSPRMLLCIKNGVEYHVIPSSTLGSQGTSQSLLALAWDSVEAIGHGLSINLI